MNPEAVAFALAESYREFEHPRGRGGRWINKVVVSRMRPEGLRGALLSGRISNVHETGASSSYYAESQPNYAEWRRGVEERTFGLRGRPERDFPVYGYVVDAGERDDPEMEFWGDARVVFKPSVKDRTTVFQGDSLEAFDHGAKPVPFDKAPEVIGPHLGGGDFIEAQIAGGASLADIDHIEFDQTPDEEMRQLLDARNIRWTVGPRKPSSMLRGDRLDRRSAKTGPRPYARMGDWLAMPLPDVQPIAKSWVVERALSDFDEAVRRGDRARVRRERANLRAMGLRVVKA